MKNKEELQSFLNNFSKSVKQNNDKWKETYALLDTVKEQHQQIGFQLAALESSDDKQSNPPKAELGHKFYLRSNPSNNHNNQCEQTPSFVDKEDNDTQNFMRPNSPGYSS